ncbi:MAG: phosphoadenosine phosphosulfate reductase family protein [ANME-2 cluster archaeon]|nr:phosphoadenosine phosphosulfate reductase family protein [ANME-2 cluster archaeon]
MTKIYLGKMVLHWCPRCNLPVLDSTCACGSVSHKVKVTPPGDIRPAFSHDIDLINTTATAQFGAPLIPEGTIVIMNKVPSDDRMEEIIADGVALANIRYDVESGQWVLLPRMEGAARIFTQMNGRSNWVMIDGSAVPFIEKGASTLAPGVIDADPGIVPGAEVVVVSPDGVPVAAGRAKMSGREMVEATKGVAVKTRWNGRVENVPVPDPHSWDEVVSANMHILKDFEAKAQTFIRNVSESTRRPVSVSYSGGKDSLATLLLVKDCIEDFEVLFADTGLEFPETVANVDDVAGYYNLQVRIYSAGDVFWESFDRFGPPTVEARWCCKTCKLGPISMLIEEHFPDGCLTFIGQRKYESEGRARSDKIWKNPWVGNQIAASPIQNWTALHIWLYLFWKGAPHNPLYEQGFDRIGCWLCPSGSMAELSRIKELHPEMWARFEEKLRSHAEKFGYGEGWVDFGLWRWQNPPQVQREMAQRLGINLVPNVCNGDMEFSMVSGYRPCKAGGVSAEGSFGVPLNLEVIEDSGMLMVLGDVHSMDGVVTSSQGEDTVQVFASGTMTARSDTDPAARRLMGRAESSIRRALECTGCGLCVAKCEVRAVQVKDGRAMVNEKCTHCGLCLTACPVVRYLGTVEK